MNILIERKTKKKRAHYEILTEKINTEEKTTFRRFSNHKHARFYKCARQLWDKQFNYGGLIIKFLYLHYYVL